MARKNFSTYALTLFLAAAGTASAATIVGAIEDLPGSGGYEKNGDFNDLIFEMTGNFTITAPGVVANPLTSSVVNQNGTIFWDNPSIDGPDMNIGYLINNPSYPDLSFPGIDYLATSAGGSLNTVYFDALGPVTVTYLGGIAGLQGQDTLGWSSLSNPATLNKLIPGGSTAGYSVTFDPDGNFALYSTNGLGQIYSSIAANNVNECATQQHFAFFAEAPEPSTEALSGLGVALLGLGLARKRR